MRRPRRVGDKAVRVFRLEALPAMRNLKPAPILLLAFVLSVSVYAQTDPLPQTDPSQAGFAPDRLGRLHGFAQGLVEERKYSGLSTLVVRDGKIVIWQAYGERTAGSALKTNDIFAIASLTKLITTVGLLTLVEEGRIGLNDPVSDYLPEFRDARVLTGGSNQPPVFAALARPITVKHLLTHTAGLSGSTPVARKDTGAPTKVDGDFASLADMVRELSTHALLHQPGDAWVYGPATDVVGRLIEVVSGKPFDVFLMERVFTPLKMKETAFEVPSEKQPRQVAMDARQADGSLKSSPAKTRQHPWPSGAGGLFSTQADYIRFAQMLLGGGKLESVRLLSPKMVELMTTDHLFGLAKPTKIYPVSDGFGLGVEVRTDVARSGWLGSQGTYGWNGATTAYCSIDPKERVIAMIWAQHTPNAEFQLYERFNTLVYQALLR